MPNKRLFKKSVESVGASVCNNMMAAYYNIDGIDREKVANAVSTMLGAVATAKDNANIFFDRGPRAFDGDMKAYTKAKREFFKALFAKIGNDFNEELQAALKEFNEAVPESARKAAKESVSKD